MEVIKHGDNLFDVKFHQVCKSCGAELMYSVDDQVSMPDADGVFCPECFSFLNHEDSERILVWLNKNGEMDIDEGDLGGTRYR